MDFLITKRVPCSVCGVNTFRHEGWFLVVENRWLDHLKIFTWHPSLAAQKGVKSACCREHVRTLIAHWLEQASLRLIPQADRLPMPITSDSARTDADLDPRSVGCLLGELSVHRESFSRVWTGSPESLECILDALIPLPNSNLPKAPEFPLFGPSLEPTHGLPSL